MAQILVLVATFLSVLGGSCVQTPNTLAQAEYRYPNELPTFQFYQTARWRSLVPLVSAMEDVHKILGPPAEASDVSAVTKPYPGDDKAKEPVFTYRLDPEWEVLVYFTRYCFHSHAKEISGDKLCSVDLIPTKRVSFDSATFPTLFKKTHIRAVDAEWDEYSDGTGLRYEIYSTRTQYGKELPGDLSRISYGPSIHSQEQGVRAKEENLYSKALFASITAMEKSWGHIDDSYLGIRTNYHHMFVEKDSGITNDLPEQLGDYRVEYLDTQNQIARSKELGKPFSILKISPMKDDGARLKIQVTVYWVEYKKSNLTFSLSDRSDVDFRYDCETESFVLSNVKLSGI